MESILIDQENLDFFSPLIPDFFHTGILKGEITALAYCEDTDEDTGPERPAFVIGAVLIRQKSDWLEIVWAGLTDDFVDTDTGVQMIRDLLMSAALDPGLRGVFAEFSPAEKEFAVLLEQAGFTLEYTKGNVFTFNADMVKWPPLKKNLEGKTAMCTLLKDAGNVEKNNIIRQLEEDPRDIPLPVPVDWTQYDDELSYLYLQPDGYGMILVSDHEDHVQLDFMAANSPLIAGYLLSGALDSFSNSPSAKKQIVLSTVTAEVEKMVLRYVPEAGRIDVAQAYLLF